MNEPTTEQLFNQPKEFKIGEKTVLVVSQPPGAVTLIILAMVEKIKGVDLDVIKAAASEEKPADIGTIYEVFEQRLKTASAKDFRIFQMILTSPETWRRTKGSLKKTDYPVTEDEIEWGATDAMLMEIFDEWVARNPRFELQKKMTGATLAR